MKVSTLEEAKRIVEKATFVPLKTVAPLGVITIEQEGEPTVTFPFDHIIEDPALEPRESSLRLRTLSLGSELFAEVKKELQQ